MDIFDHFLPWTELRVNSIDTDQWRLLLSPVAAIKQDQSIPITNLMVLLHTKIYGQCSLKETVHRSNFFVIRLSKPRHPHPRLEKERTVSFRTPKHPQIFLPMPHFDALF